MEERLLSKPLTEITKEELQKDISRIFQMDYGPHEIEEICNIYFAAVQIGDRTTDLANVCKDVLRMIRLGSDHIVKSKLHRLLCCAQDSYYDFVFTIENNVKNDLARQGRLIHFLSMYRLATSYEITVYDSLIDMDPDITDEEIVEIMPYFYQDEIAFKDQLVTAREMEVFELINHGWIQSKVFVNNHAYTICQTCSTCLVDYLNHCVASCCLNKCQEGVGRIIFIKTKTATIHEDLTDFLLDYLEIMAKKTHLTKIIVDKTTPCWDFYMEHGYEPVDGEKFGYPGEQVLFKDFTPKRIAPSFVIPDFG